MLDADPIDIDLVILIFFIYYDWKALNEYRNWQNFSFKTWMLGTRSRDLALFFVSFKTCYKFGK